MEVLSRNWEKLKARENYLNSAVGTKLVKGIDTGTPAIVIYVRKKRPAVELSPEEMIPPEIEGIPTDIIELAPTGWVADRTAISELHPAEQLRRLGLQTKPPKIMAATSKRLLSGTPKGASEWTAYAYPARDQGNCGACTAHGNCKVWETKIRIVANNPVLGCQLSVAHLFFCTPGASCENGSTVDAILTQAMNGVCLESCLPYQPVDQGCAVGICANWWEAAYKLAGYNKFTDPTDIKVLLDQEPLNCTMAVYNSFFNYVSGVYKHIPNEPLAGYHDIANLGYSDFLVADLIGNSWGLAWGPGCMVNGVKRPGDCWIAYGELDAERQQLLLNGPVPVPPTPSTGTLILSTVPTGAEVSVDGTAIGVSPQTRNLSAENHLISVTLSGYQTESHVIAISAGSTVNVTFDLNVSPSPSKCKVGNGIAKTLNIYSKLAHRQGRFYYLNPPK